MTIKRKRQAGIGHQERAAFVVPHGVDDGNELGGDSALREREVDCREHFSWARLNRRVRTQNPAHQRRIDCSRRALAADVSNGDPQAREGIRNEVVEIAANGARRHKLGRDFKIRELE